MCEKKTVLLTFDVEDWFQVENFKEYIDFSTWDSFKPRVEKNTHTILNLLDSFSFRPKATFFVLGWTAKKMPGLVSEILKRGHEVASHGNDHHLCTTLKPRQLLNDLRDSRHILEDITGQKIYGYRAPSFAINDDILSIIAQAGYAYDSSYNSFGAHGRYGAIDLTRAKKKGGAYQISPSFFELPVSNLKFFGQILPLGGGGYFRLYPLSLFKLGMKSILKQNPFVFYAHPWEFDKEQPVVEQASLMYKFRHYINLGKTQIKLKNLIGSFSQHGFATCIEYTKLLKNTAET